MNTVGIISDTHGTLGADVVGCLCGCDHIIHAGDIGDPSILTELQQVAPVSAVLGNNDYEIYPRGTSHKTLSVTIEGVVFTVAHIPRQLFRDLANVVSYYENKGVKPPKIVAIHGHTHVPEIKTEVDAKPADLIVCPGSASRPRGGSVASFSKIEVDDCQILACEIRDLNDKVLLSAEGF